HSSRKASTTRPARKHYVRPYQTQKGGGEPTMTDQERATVSDARDDLPFIVHSQLDDLDLDPFEFRAYAHMVRRAGLGKNGGAGEHWESIEKSAKHCRMDVKTYRRALRGLVERRLVTREDRVGQTSVYRLTPPRAWRPLPE